MLAAALALLLVLPTTDTTAAQPPSQVLLMQAVQAYVGPLDAPGEDVRVRTEWADLTGDGVDDALVYLDAPSWCGSGGCTVLVFEAITDAEAVAELGAYRAAAEISLMSGPVTIAETAHEGWSDLVVTREDGVHVVLRFDGETYPQSPADGVAMSGPAGGTVLFADAE